MKSFSKLQMVLFDSTNAGFKLCVEAQFRRGNQQQGFKNLVYVTNAGTGMLTPNIYLTLTCKDGADQNTIPNPVYTSYPQLFRLREALEKVKDLVATGAGFVKAADGKLSVKQDCADPIVLDNIGKGNNWIGLKLCIIEAGDNGVITQHPAVSIELSTSNGSRSVLTVEEFLTVYTIVKDLDLASLACTMSLAFLSCPETAYAMPTMPGAPAAFPMPAQAPVYPQQPQMYGAPQQPSMYQQRPAQPRYGNQGYRTSRQSYTPSPAPQPTVPPMVDATPMMQPRPQQTSLPPRSEVKQPVMNLKAVEETPISEATFDNSSVIDELFNED